jgi:nitroreductase
MDSMRLEELLLLFIDCNRLDQGPVDEAALLRLVELTRLAPSLGSRQPLKYLLAWQPAQIDRIALHLSQTLTPARWTNPARDGGPLGYILILGDRRISFLWDWDCRVAAQTILLGATIGGLDGYVFRSIDRAALRAALGLPDHLEILMVVALGEVRESVVLENGRPARRPEWRDAECLERLPLRTLAELRVTVPGF